MAYLSAGLKRHAAKRHSSTKSAPVATNDKSLHLRFSRAHKAPRLSKRLYKGIKRAMGYPCHLHISTQDPVEVVTADGDQPYHVYEDRVLNALEARDLWQYGFDRMERQIHVGGTTGGSVVGPAITESHNWRLKIDTYSVNYTIQNTSASRLQVIAYEFVPRHDISTFLSWRGGVSVGSVFAAIGNGVADLGIQTESNDAATAFINDIWKSDMLSNPLDSSRFAAINHHFKLIRKRRFGVDSGQQAKYSTSWTPSRLISGIDVQPQLFNGGTAPTVASGQGAWFLTGMSRLIFFQCYGDLATNTALTLSRFPEINAVISSTKNIHFVAQQVTEETTYTRYDNSTMIAGGATDHRVMPCTSTYVAGLNPVQT